MPSYDSADIARLGESPEIWWLDELFQQEKGIIYPHKWADDVNIRGRLVSPSCPCSIKGDYPQISLEDKLVVDSVSRDGGLLRFRNGPTTAIYGINFCRLLLIIFFYP